MKGGNAIRWSVAAVLAAGLGVGHAEPTGNWVALTNSTVNAYGEINAWFASYWDDGRDPHPDADYKVVGIQGSMQAHTPKWGTKTEYGTPTNFIFGGNSLWLTNNASLVLVCVDRLPNADAPIRVTIPGDGVIATAGGTQQVCQYETGTANLFSKLTVYGKKFKFYSSDYGDVRSMRIWLRGPLVGDSTSVVNIAGRSPQFVVRLDGDCSAFSGSIVVKGELWTPTGASKQKRSYNELELCDVTIPGSITVEATNRLMTASSVNKAGVGTLTFADEAILAVSVEGEEHANGTITVTDKFTQGGRLVVCLTNHAEKIAAVRSPASPVLTIAAGATGTFDLANIAVEPAADAEGRAFRAFARRGADQSLSLYIGYGCEVGETSIYGAGGLTLTAGKDGKAKIGVDGSVAKIYPVHASLTRLLNAARLRLDANVEDSLVYMTSGSDVNKWGLVDPEGRKYVARWTDVNGSDHYFYRWENSGKSAAGEPIRRVSSYTTVQQQTVNGVTRSYMDFGQIDGSTGRTDTNKNTTNQTASAMRASTSAGAPLTGIEYHLVHSDAHIQEGLLTGEGEAWRPVLLGRTNAQPKPNNYPGRRGDKGEIFTKGQTDAFTAEGCITVDNISTNCTYVPEWGDVHVYTLIPTNALADGRNFSLFDALGCDTYARYGGQRTGELLVYADATNSVAERKLIDEYLMKKWMNAGNGPSFAAVDSIVLSAGASLAVASDIGQESDVGCETEVGTLGGDGTLTLATIDAVRADNLSFAFTSRNACESLTVSGGAFVLGPAGTLTVTKAAGVSHPKDGTYTLLTVPSGTDLSAFDGWTMDVSALGVDGVRVYRQGNAILMDVPKRGMVLLFR